MSERLSIAKFHIFSKLKSANHQIRVIDSDKTYTVFEAGGKRYQKTCIFYHQFTRLTFGVSVFQRAICGGERTNVISVSYVTCEIHA